MDDPSKVPIGEYLASHSKPNGGWKGFLHSNLFGALLLWALGQAGFAIWFLFKVSVMLEWKGKAENKIDELDKQETKDRYTIDQHAAQIGSLSSEVATIREDTKHFDVMEAEHVRLTKDVENLKNGRK